MHPILFSIGPFTVYSYGVMLAIAVLVCTWLLSREACAHHMSADIIYDFVFWCLLGGILCARIFYVFIEWPYFSQNLLEILMLQKGGLAWQGGFLGGALLGVWFVYRHQLPLRQMLDLTAPYIALGQSIGRIGCFFNGCCYGKPVSWGIYFSAQQARLYPTQLFECLGLFIIFLILKKAQSTSHESGYIFIFY
ncbi:MAG: prolipoprotein diacylglyceryl transferase, partial [Candidatus Omnitrophica bacterium]|nr:prolipoprotein diacylglyceryl transferase [Candidatus Omnitrophota bacterium]